MQSCLTRRLLMGTSHLGSNRINWISAEPALRPHKSLNNQEHSPLLTPPTWPQPRGPPKVLTAEDASLGATITLPTGPTL